MQHNLKSWIGTIIQAVLVATLVCLIYWGWLVVNSPKYFPVRHIKIITTEQYLPVKKIENLVSANLQGGFFSVNSDKLQQVLTNSPWIAMANIRRVWPSTLEITVIEKQPTLIWNGAELVSSQGQLFAPDLQTFPKNLPNLSGPEDDFMVVYDKYKLYSRLLKFLGLKIKALSLSPRLSWSLQLDNGILVKLGESNVDRRLARFVKLYQRIIGENSSCVEHADLRYPNGLAIKWKCKVKGNK